MTREPLTYETGKTILIPTAHATLKLIPLRYAASHALGLMVEDEKGNTYTLTINTQFMPDENNAVLIPEINLNIAEKIENMGLGWLGHPINYGNYGAKAWTLELNDTLHAEQIADHNSLQTA